MKHFDNWQWADFVRGLGDTPTRSMMQSHLSTGCAGCQNTADRLRAVAVEARADAEYAPPEPVLRYAQAIFAMNRPEKVSERFSLSLKCGAT